MPRKAGAPIARIEINGPFREGDPVLDVLRAEASARNTSVQQHIYDILRARYLASQGQSYIALLWTPSDPAVSPQAAIPPPAPPDAASQAASAWLAMLDADADAG
ncbi:MAG: hypothetical protein IPK75_17930 [Acidobacteria bacterium]|nr:hypothetical protein [Acidobacteriota bacterium]